MRCVQGSNLVAILTLRWKRHWNEVCAQVLSERIDAGRRWKRHWNEVCAQVYVSLSQTVSWDNSKGTRLKSPCATAGPPRPV